MDTWYATAYKPMSTLASQTNQAERHKKGFSTNISGIWLGNYRTIYFLENLRQVATRQFQLR